MGRRFVVTASQKSLMCPPGLAVAAVSEKAMRVIDAAHGIPRFFFDFRRAKASLDKGETPFTPPVSLILGLREALAMINEEGLPAVLRASCASVGGAARRLRGARISDVSAGAVLIDRHGRRRPGRSRRRGDRAPHVRELPHRDRRPAHQTAQPRHPHRHDGHFGPEDILADLHYLECTLRDLGRAAATGAGVQAAAALWRASRRLSFSAVVCIRPPGGGPDAEG